MCIYLFMTALMVCRWADFQNPFIGRGINPQNTWSSPPQNLGLFGQFTKLYNCTEGSFKLTLAIGGWTWSANFTLAVNSFLSSLACGEHCYIISPMASILRSQYRLGVFDE